MAVEAAPLEVCVFALFGAEPEVDGLTSEPLAAGLAVGHIHIGDLKAWKVFDLSCGVTQDVSGNL